MHSIKLVLLGTTGVLALLIVIACESDADQIREINESLRSPTLTPAATKPLEATIDSSDIQDGDCIRSTIEGGITIETVVIVPCNEAWQYRVLNSFEVEGSDYPSESEFEHHAFSKCDRRYTYFLFPVKEGWESVFWPDRKVNCLQDSFGLSKTDPAKLDRLVAPSSLKARECFNEAPHTDELQVEIVNCANKWQYRVLNLFDVVQSSYPSDLEFQKQAFTHCDPRYTTIFLPEEAWPDWRVVCVQESFGFTATDPDLLDRLIALESLEAGQCFSEAPETSFLQVELVECSGNWDYKVVNVISVPNDSTYPGDSYFQDRADLDCDSSTDTYFSPSEESWDIGDNKILCTISK